MEAGDGGPFGAVIVRAGEVLGSGWNQVATTNDPTAHAEIIAIRKAAATLQTFDLRGCTLYCSCEPCPMCLGAAYWARVDRIVYAGSRADAADAGFDDDAFYSEFMREPANRRLPHQQILRNEAMSVFEGWKAKPDKILY